MLLEQDIIQPVGISDARGNGRAAGLKLRLRKPPYRGMAASLIEGFAVPGGISLDDTADAARWTMRKTHTLGNR